METAADYKWTVETQDELDGTLHLESVACDSPIRRMYQKVSWLD
jgi:hypothetical protein